MAKQSYKIPDSLDKSFMDVEIAVQSNDGVGLKPLPLKVILSWIVSALVCLYMVLQSFVSAGNVVAKVFFVITWFGLTALLLRENKTKQMQFTLIPTLLNYVNKRNRTVITRKSAPANDFRGVAGIDNVVEDTGLINFIDGTYGFAYRVVGTGSILLFDEDRDAILNRVDSFYRKMKTDYEIIFLTSKESQKVYRQVANLKKRFDNLDESDTELRGLAEQQYYYLKDVVGGSFRSTHQYMIIKADNKEALLTAKNMLQSECEGSTLMIKQCTALTGDDLVNLHALVFKGEESV